MRNPHALAAILTSGVGERAGDLVEWGTMNETSDITQLLRAARSGDRASLDAVMPLVYAELHQLAHRRLAANAPLNTTTLVHEAYLRLVGQRHASFDDRRQFFAYAATVMRSIVVDYARRQQARKRATPPAMLELDGTDGMGDVPIEELLDVDRALAELERFDQRLSHIVEMRVFAGLTVEEIAELLELSARTIKREWRKARALLLDLIGSDGVVSETP
jgi:RNA polymerase sigma factor (TIGR02999 family)